MNTSSVFILYVNIIKKLNILGLVNLVNVFVPWVLLDTFLLVLFKFLDETFCHSVQKMSWIPVTGSRYCIIFLPITNEDHINVDTVSYSTYFVTKFFRSSFPSVEFTDIWRIERLATVESEQLLLFTALQYWNI